MEKFSILFTKFVTFLKIQNAKKNHIHQLSLLVTPQQQQLKNPLKDQGICEDIEYGTVLPYPGRCDLYIKCIEPAPPTFSCPSDLEFNAETKICQDPKEAGCSIPKVTPEFPTTTEASKLLPPPIYPGICSNYSNGELIPYPGNCSQYILCCDIPIATAQECPYGQEFNAKLQICETPEDAGCSILTPTEPPGCANSTTGLCKDNKPGDVIPYPGKCNKFIECGIKVSYGRTCKNGYHFNPKLLICDEPTSAQCLTAALLCFP
ncbi:probable endochitinase [Episyrphus balteatus]|uniref:probable endochitinase n=1 Tax=Episyrphus balteatus TaxID=286459 RepID=UPI002486B7B7|nr:probable endochitinase [Episyrphus balteatus]